jgi:hypothetical protein
VIGAKRERAAMCTAFGGASTVELQPRAAPGVGLRTGVSPWRVAGNMGLGVRAKCCGCTEAFQASRAGSIPVARLLATGSGAVW